eukprot:gene41432-18469_t
MAACDANAARGVPRTERWGLLGAADAAVLRHGRGFSSVRVFVTPGGGGAAPSSPDVSPQLAGANGIAVQYSGVVENTMTNAAWEPLAAVLLLLSAPPCDAKKNDGKQKAAGNLHADTDPDKFTEARVQGTTLKWLGAMGSGDEKADLLKKV